MTMRTEVYRIPRVREDSYIQSNSPILVEYAPANIWIGMQGGRG